MRGAMTKWLQRRAARREPDRGATLVEYALVLTLLVVVSIAAIQSLDSAARDEVANQEECVSSRPPPATCQTLILTTSTTVVPPSTTATTQPPPPPPVNAATYENTRSEVSGSSWAAITTIVLTSDGAPLPDVFVRYRAQLITPPGPTFFVSCVTGADGRCELRFEVPDIGQPVDTVQLTADLIDSDPQVTVDPPPLTFTRP